MIQVRHLFLNYLLMILFLLFVCGVQSTLWFHLTGGAPAPMLWLNFALYFLLYRKPAEGLLATYGVGFILTGFSGAPLGLIWTSLLVMGLGVLFVKSRVFWPSTRYFVLMSAGSSLAFHLFSFFISRFLETNPTGISFFYRFFEILQTPLWAGPIYWALLSIDRISQRGLLPESSGVEE